MIQSNKTGKPRRMKTGSTLPEMTNESGKAYRDALIASGQIVPNALEFRKTDDGNTVPLRPMRESAHVPHCRFLRLASAFCVFDLPRSRGLGPHEV